MFPAPAFPADEDTGPAEEEEQVEPTPDEPEAEAATAAAAGSGMGQEGDGAISGRSITAPESVAFTMAASYSIPIEVPPGILGMAPNLALTYSSSRRNGWIGVGYDLDMGSIQRNTKKGVSSTDFFTGTDFVAAINGSAVELAARPDWEEWAPEIESVYGSKIEGAFMQFGRDSTTGGWVARAKDGTKYYYGRSQASRQQNGDAKIFRWKLDKVEDVNHNRMEVKYTNANGEVYLKSIEYTKNGSFSSNNRVDFILEPRTDTVLSYLPGWGVKTVSRLKAIEVRGNGELARKYVLNYVYSASTSRSLLQ